MRRVHTYLPVLLVAVGIALAGCDSTRSPVAPGDDMSAQFAKKSGLRRIAAVVEPGSSEASISANGGTIVVRNSSGDTIAFLEIPAGTVKKDTQFTIDISADFHVELQATSAQAREPNDVGSAGFRKRLILGLNTQYFQENATSLAELKLNDVLVPVPSSIDGGWLIGELRHFSGYVAVTD